jgi:hypothetical protein
MVQLLRIFLLGLKCTPEAGYQSTACHHGLVSRVLRQSIFLTVLIKCSVGLLGQLKFCLADIVLFGIIMVGG